MSSDSQSFSEVLLDFVSQPKSTYKYDAQFIAQFAGIPTCSSESGYKDKPKHTKLVKCHDDAVVPTKAHPTDSGYDVTVIRHVEGTNLYGTGWKISPPNDMTYYELYSRSSLHKLGYILANGVGIIDTHYRGEIFVPLIKIDQSKPDLELPCRIAQLIPKTRVDVEFEVYKTLDETERGSGGFGSSG